MASMTDNPISWRQNEQIGLCDPLEPKQFKNNLIMLEDKPQFEFAAS